MLSEETQARESNEILFQVALKGLGESQGYNSVMEHLPSMWKALGLIASTTKSTK